MSFFDNKKEVFDIILTAHGKKLLSEGKFKPKFYSFFDDEMIYNNLFTGVSESQNSIEGRILEQTPYMKLFNPSYDSSNAYQTKQTNITNATLTLPIGTSDTTSDYYPAWNIKCLKGDIFSSYSSSSRQTEQIGINKKFIPQIDMVTQSTDIYILQDITSEELEFNKFYISRQFENGTITAKVNENIYDFFEANTENKKDNFEIEVFKVEADSAGNESLIPLDFIKRATNIKDNILLDNFTDGLTDDQAASLRISNLNENFVESYFTILVDDEIPFERLNIEKLDIYSGNMNRLRPNKDNC